MLFHYYQKLLEIDIVGDIRHKGMLMGIELVSDKNNCSNSFDTIQN